MNLLVYVVILVVLIGGGGVLYFQVEHDNKNTLETYATDPNARESDQSISSDILNPPDQEYRGVVVDLGSLAFVRLYGSDSISRSPLD